MASKWLLKDSKKFDLLQIAIVIRLSFDKNISLFSTRWVGFIYKAKCAVLLSLFFYHIVFCPVAATAN